MADYDYLGITDSEMLPGRPVKTSLFFRLRNNAIAMIQGGANAPRIEAPAFGSPGVGELAQYFEHPCVQNNMNWSDVPYVMENSRFYVHITGGYRLRTRYKFSGSGFNWGYQIVIIRAGGDVLGTNWQELGVSGTRQGTHTEDFILLAGDEIRVNFRGLGGSDGQLYLTIATNMNSKFPFVSKYA